MSRYFAGGPVLNNRPDNGVIPGGGPEKFPHALGQPNLWATTTAAWVPSSLRAAPRAAPACHN